MRAPDGETRSGADDPSTPLIRGIGVITGWGEGVHALPDAPATEGPVW